jgi:hypothetical protein
MLLVIVRSSMGRLMEFPLKAARRAGCLPWGLVHVDWPASTVLGWLCMLLARGSCISTRLHTAAIS